MADNVNVTPGSGATIAADDVGGVLHQRVKLVMGGEGVSEGDVASDNPMPVKATDLSVTLDTALAVLVAILEKMPRVTANDQAAVSVEGVATVGLASNQTLANMSAVGTKFVTGDNLNMAGVQHLYSNIIVT